MSVIEYLYNIISIILIVDFIYCIYQMCRYYLAVCVFGLRESSRIKIFIEGVVTITYIAYWIYKLLIH